MPHALETDPLKTPKGSWGSWGGRATVLTRAWLQDRHSNAVPQTNPQPWPTPSAAQPLPQECLL